MAYKDRDTINQKAREYRAKHREEINARTRERYKTNPEFRKQSLKEAKQWKENNRERYNDNQNRWFSANLDKVKEYRRKKPEMTRYFMIRSAAKKRNIPFTITKDEFKKLWYSTDNCEYCKKPIMQGIGNGYQKNNRSFDRKDNTKGYELSNLVVCCYLCNRIKNDEFSYDEMCIIGKIIQTHK